jgi:ribosomal protein L7Ae-like RNA K-turn-binding protein
MYHVERSMLFIGLIDVINSIKLNLANFIILAENATHLSAPLNFFARLTKLANAKNIPYIYACKKEQLAWACRLSTSISVISIKVGHSYFSEKINAIKNMLTESL